MVPLLFASQELLLSASGALFWPARRALLVADLHLEKASWFAARGQPLPPYDSRRTLEALSETVAATGAREVWCLGDSFHDAHGAERLSGDARALLRALTDRTAWTWIGGNHDPVLADACGGHMRAEAGVDGLLLRHQADPAETRPEISGHFHPKLRLRLRGHLLSRRCFVLGAAKLILPAFGALTGGLDAGAPAIRDAVGVPAAALVPNGGRLLHFPLAA